MKESIWRQPCAETGKLEIKRRDHASLLWRGYIEPSEPTVGRRPIKRTREIACTCSRRRTKPHKGEHEKNKL